jgi:phage shock protein PspC (stress-responsive transcriptional regulator)
LGVANRIGIAPGLLRILMVVLTLASNGLGILLYALGVIAIPREPGTRGSRTAWGVLALLLVIAVGGLLSWDAFSGWPLIVAVIVGVIVLCNRDKRKPGLTAEPTPFERASDTWRDRLSQVRAAAESSDTTSLYSQSGAEIAVDEIEGQVPATWRGWLFASALVGIGVGTVAAFRAMGLIIPMQVWPAVVLLALGITLTISTWKGRPRFMVPVTVVVAAVTVAMTAPATGVSLMSAAGFSAGGGVYHYSDAESVPDVVDGGVGKLVLDFAQLQLGDSETLDVVVNHRIGEVILALPTKGGYRVDWSLGVGELKVVTDGHTEKVSVFGGHNDVLEHGPVDGPILNLNVDVGMGTLEVRVP